MNKVKNNKGFTLIEVVVAMSILVIALISVITLSTLGVKTVVKSKAQTEAISYAQYAMEVLNQKAGVDGACSYENTTSTDFLGTLGVALPPGITGSYTISDVPNFNYVVNDDGKPVYNNAIQALATVSITTNSYGANDTITLKQIIDRN